MKIYSNPWIQWKSSEDKKLARNRAKVSSRPASRLLPFCKGLNIHTPWCPKTHDINRNLWKSAQKGILESRKGFQRSSRSTLAVLPRVKHPYLGTPWNLWNWRKFCNSATFIEMHKNNRIYGNTRSPLEPMKINLNHENPRNTVKVCRGQGANLESSNAVVRATGRLLPL